MQPEKRTAARAGTPCGRGKTTSSAPEKYTVGLLLSMLQPCVEVAMTLDAVPPRGHGWTRLSDSPAGIPRWARRDLSRGRRA